MRRSYAILFALVVLLSTVMSVQAVEYKSIERHSGSSAYASWTQTNSNVTTSTSLSVSETEDGTDIYLDIYTSGPGFWSGKSGYTLIQDDVFKVNKKLNSASLSEVEIDVYNWYTGQTETLTVKADWTGNGDLSTGSSSYSSRNGDYIWKSSESSSSREASATGSTNGFDFGVTPYASLSNFKSAYIIMEK